LVEPDAPVSFDFEPGILFAGYSARDIAADDQLSATARVVSVPENVNIREPRLQVEDGVLTLDLRRIPWRSSSSDL
jgi:hypothetical protein